MGEIVLLYIHTMPRLETNRNLTIRDFVTRLIDPTIYGVSDSIVIASEFQRGDEETGIWTISQQRNLVDSVQRNFPIGNITLVKDHESAMAYNEPWMVLDGGNRARSLRDYILDLIQDKQERKYSELDVREQARIDNIHIQIIWITIERNDPPNIISEMFARLNTSASPLSQGELIKAQGWKGNVPEIEMAKKLIGDDWMTDFSCPSVVPLRAKWIDTFGDLGETKRCDTLAMMCGFIVSAKEGNFAYFEKKYSVLYPKFTNPMCPNEEHAMTQEKQHNIVKKLNTFTNLMNKIPLTLFGSSKKGILPKSKVAPIWKCICEDKMTPQLRKKMIQFYEQMNVDDELRSRYESALTKNGNNEMTTEKIDNVLTMIDHWNPDE